MMPKKALFLRFWAACALLFLCSCSAPQVKLNLSSTENLNMDGKQEPLPVVVRIYQLTDPKNFENATFNELWKKDLATLGNTLLRKDSLTLDPASTQQVRFERHEQARYVALMAAFNHQPNNSWRIVRETNGAFLGIDLSTRLKVLLKDNVIEVVD